MRKPPNSIGRCIYCDSKDGLTREHIIPQGIGGRLSPKGRHEALVLRDASCHVCTKIIHHIETECQSKMMGIFRAKHGFNRKDRRLDTLQIKITSADGSVTQQHVDPSDLPSAMFVPVFNEPGLFGGTPIGGPYYIQFVGCFRAPPKPLVPGASYNMAGIGPDVFGHMLAKIGLGFAVSQLGIDGFKPLVREFIRGKKDEFGHWIGGPMNAPAEPPSQLLHELRLALFGTNSAEYVAVYIRLFANFGCPRNYVIVGQTR